MWPTTARHDWLGYCTRSGDTLRHVIDRTSNRPPLVETEGTDFVMVKLADGAPYTTQRPTGVTFTSDLSPRRQAAG